MKHVLTFNKTDVINNDKYHVGINKICRSTYPRLVKHHGFTLIEMLIVIAIIAILASMTLPSLINASKMSYQVSCANNLKKQGIMINIYAGEYNSYLPNTGRVGPSGGISDMDYGYGRYSNNAAHFLRLMKSSVDSPDECYFCPADVERKPENFQYLYSATSMDLYRGISYAYYGSWGTANRWYKLGSVKRLTNRKITAIMSDHRTWTSRGSWAYNHTNSDDAFGKVNLLFLDSHVSFDQSRQTDFLEMLYASYDQSDVDSGRTDYAQ